MLGREVKQSLEKSGHLVSAPTSAELNLRDANATLNCLKSFQPEVVIHSAALVGGIQANIEGGGRFLTENLEIDHSIIFGSKALGVKNFVYVGSSCMYPTNSSDSLRIQDLLSGPLEPTNANYALAKILGAKAVEAIDSMKGVNWKTFIASNLYGPGDHFEPDRSHLLAAIIAKVDHAKKQNLKEIVMWGEGVVRREFTYVTDFALWISDSVSQLERFPSMLNVGYGIDYSVREYYEMVMQELGYKGVLVPDKTKPNGILSKLMDSSVARSFGWSPSTSIRQGINQTHEWFKEQNGPR
jgi:GDP-L-fucose synthase